MLVVWLPMMETDTPETAQKAIEQITDSRALHFWDEQKLSAQAIAKSVGYEGRVAWDFYLFYPADVKWEDEPPTPVVWIYQPSDDWTEPEHMREDETLVAELTNGMKKVAV